MTDVASTSEPSQPVESPTNTDTRPRRPCRSCGTTLEQSHIHASIERVERAYEEHLEADGDDGSQASLAGERALASIERVSDDLQEKVGQFEEREDALRERFQEAMG
jgi:hypothetical protein